LAQVLLEKLSVRHYRETSGQKKFVFPGMIEVQTSEVDVIPAQFSLAQQWVRTGKHCWVREGIAGLKYKGSMEGK
jgi:hypothetical protein